MCRSWVSFDFSFNIFYAVYTQFIKNRNILSNPFIRNAIFDNPFIRSAIFDNPFIRNVIFNVPYYF